MTDAAARASRRARRLRWWGLALMVAALGAFIVLGANRPADPYLLPTQERAPVDGFGEIAYRVEPGDGTQRCALLADTAEQRARGLMGRTDLAGHDGMLFRFAAETTTAFYMKDTPMPLSIAWFDAGGSFVSATDMEPCLGRDRCPTYAPAGPYRYALEVPRGGLPGLGVGPGSRLILAGDCR